MERVYVGSDMLSSIGSDKIKEPVQAKKPKIFNSAKPKPSIYKLLCCSGHLCAQYHRNVAT